MKERPDWRWLLSVAAAMAWAFVVIALYYVVHKPIGLSNAAALLSALRDLLVAALVIGAGTGIGLRCLARAGDMAGGQGADALETLLFGAGLGLGALGLIMLGVGLVGGLYRPVMWALVIGGLALGGREAIRLVRRAWGEALPLPAGLFYRFVAVFIGATLVLALLQALLPPTAWDSLTYHLTGPKLYLEAHRFIPDVDIVHLGFPALIEMLYAAGMSLGSSAVPQVIGWAFGLLTLLLMYAFVRRHLAGELSSDGQARTGGTPSTWDVRVAWLAMALLLSAPTVVLLLHWAYVEPALMFYELSAVYAFVRWRESDDRRWLALAGVCCGFGMGAKYTAVSLTVALALLVLWRRRAMLWRGGLPDVLRFGGVAGLVTLPWLLKNGFFLGNPFYPFVFGGVHWDAQRQAWYAQPGSGLAYTAPWQLLTAPWDMTIYGIEGKVGFSATIGPLYLIGLFILPFVWRHIPTSQRDVLRPVLAVCGVQYVLWLAAAAQSGPLVQTRLLLPAFPLLAMLAASGFVHAAALRRPQFALDWVLKVVVALSLSLNLLGALVDAVAINPLAHILGWESERDYLNRRLGWHYATMEHINRELPQGSRLYYLWETRSFYCDRPSRPDAVLDAFLHLVYRFGDASAIAAHLKAAGYTHVLLYQQGLEFVLAETDTPLGERELAILDELRADYLRPVHVGGQAYVLYELR